MSAGASELLARYRSWGVQVPRRKELSAELDKPDKEITALLGRLLEAGQLVRINSDYYLADTTVVELRDKLTRHLDSHGQITPAEWKGITGASRKYSIPLAEYFDKEKLTLRVGDVRKRRG